MELLSLRSSHGDLREVMKEKMAVVEATRMNNEALRRVGCEDMERRWPDAAAMVEGWTEDNSVRLDYEDFREDKMFNIPRTAG